MKIVITYGTYDLLHYGHIEIFRRAKELAEGGRLIVAISTDEFNWNEKRKKTQIPYEKRKELVESIGYVDLVIPEESWEQKKDDVKKYNVDLLVMGDDWEGKFDDVGCETKYLPRTPSISSSAIKRVIKDIKDDLESL